VHTTGKLRTDIVVGDPLVALSQPTRRQTPATGLIHTNNSPEGKALTQASGIAGRCRKGGERTPGTLHGMVRQLTTTVTRRR
jgi:hypothetical protein